MLLHFVLTWCLWPHYLVQIVQIYSSRIRLVSCLLRCLLVYVEIKSLYVEITCQCLLESMQTARICITIKCIGGSNPKDMSFFYFDICCCPIFLFSKWGHTIVNVSFFRFYIHLCEGIIVKYRKDALYRKNCQFSRKMRWIQEPASPLMLTFGLDIYFRVILNRTAATFEIVSNFSRGQSSNFRHLTKF